MNKINLFNYFSVLVLTIIIVVLLMVLVAVIPRKYIRNNVVESSEQLMKLGEKNIINLRF